MMVSVAMRREFDVTSPTRDGLDEHTDVVMEQLLALEGADLEDSAVGVNLATGRVEIEVVAHGPNFEAAIDVGSSAIRTAIHAAGGSTPDWTVTPVAQHAELVDA